MKWNEMSVFHKVVHIIHALALLAMCVVFVCFIGGVIPDLYSPPLYITFFSIHILGRSILNWKQHRVIAIIDLVAALLCVAALCWGIAVKLIVH